MITPVNGHVLIEPIVHTAFMASSQDTYEEIGIVISASDDLQESDYWVPMPGEKVYFDSWLAAKYHKEGGKPDEFYWLVKWEDVRAAEAAVEQTDAIS